jgi:acylphosphatase
MTSLRIIVSGRVQGVGYRLWCVSRATALGLDGWVRNRADGTVEAFFMGAEDGIASVREACAIGPPMARVDRVDAFEADAEALALASRQGGFAVLASA